MTPPTPPLPDLEDDTAPMHAALLALDVIAAIESARRVVPRLRVMVARGTRGHDWVASRERAALWVAEDLPPCRRSRAVFEGLAALTRAAGEPRPGERRLRLVPAPPLLVVDPVATEVG